MLVKDVMTENPITIGPEASVLEAKEIMSRNKIKKLPVVDNLLVLLCRIACLHSGAIVFLLEHRSLDAAYYLVVGSAPCLVGRLCHRGHAGQHNK